jgi:hypothetical protein
MARKTNNPTGHTMSVANGGPTGVKLGTGFWSFPRPISEAIFRRSDKGFGEMHGFVWKIIFPRSNPV